jgi:hypothetical protein
MVTMIPIIFLVAALASSLTVDAFTQPMTTQITRMLSYPLVHTPLSANARKENDEPVENNDDADKFLERAQQLREQIRLMEESISKDRKARYFKMENDNNDGENSQIKKSLQDKRVLILGANGRLGSMITRYLLRNHPEIKEAVAAVHFVGQATTRGYGRLSYEVGAEDGIGTIGAAWSSEDERNASFQFDPQTMSGYNLNKLRVVEVELLDPKQVQLFFVPPTLTGIGQRQLQV